MNEQIVLKGYIDELRKVAGAKGVSMGTNPYKPKTPAWMKSVNPALPNGSGMPGSSLSGAANPPTPKAPKAPAIKTPSAPKAPAMPKMGSAELGALILKAMTRRNANV